MSAVEGALHLDGVTHFAALSGHINMVPTPLYKSGEENGWLNMLGKIEHSPLCPCSSSDGPPEESTGHDAAGGRKGS